MKSIIMKAAILAISALAVFSCAKPDEEYVHSDCTISAIYMVNPATKAQIQGQIDQESGDILFVIPRKEASSWKDDNGSLIPVKLRANIGFDAFIQPSLLGLHQIEEEPLVVTVSAPMTGDTKQYKLQAQFSRQ